MTLVEILVVIGVVAVLAVIGTAAIQKARESARKVSCVNNLRQLGLALNAYAADIRCFPQGIYGSGYSLHAMLLPYLEQRPLFNSINFELPSTRSFVAGHGNATAYRTSVSVFLCSADRGSDGRVGWSNYAGNRGNGFQKFGFNGAFSFEAQGPIGFSSFTDGTSTTAAMAEWLLGTDAPGQIDPARSTFRTATAFPTATEFDRFLTACQELTPGPTTLNLMPKRQGWFRGDVSFTLYNHALTPGRHSCTNGTLVQHGAWTAGSLHDGVSNVLFVDGHFQGGRQTVSLDVWRALGSRDGGELVSESSF